jgi:hypothetical protein
MEGFYRPTRRQTSQLPRLSEGHGDCSTYLTMMNKMTAALMIASVMVGGAACFVSGPVTSDTGGDAASTTTLTYYHDIQPIIQAKCVECHNPDGIGPMPLETPQDVISYATLIASDVSAQIMPPWPPADTCNTYQRDRSLTTDQITTITTWVNGGTPVGDPSDQVTAPTPTGMSRVDLTLQMPQAFQPNESPDDYRCFLIPWTPTTAQYVTGLGMTPGDPHIVHHAIAYIATADQIPAYQQLAAASNDGQPGWTCFGGPGSIGSQQQWLGFWVPGSLGADFPTNTGILVQPGSAIVLQVHYNTNNVQPNTTPAPDQTTVSVELADSVTTPAALVAFSDPTWTQGNMPIPAGSADTTYNYSVDPTLGISKLSVGVLSDNVPLTVYAAGLHMHTRGSVTKTLINRKNGSSDCMLDIPGWNFSWQGAYTFTQPEIINPGDKVYLECHWNNTAANQPYINGVQVAPTNLNWGETTEEEMCLGVMYVSQ